MSGEILPIASPGAEERAQEVDMTLNWVADKGKDYGTNDMVEYF